MSEIRDQYNAFPYPHRDPADEAHRLVTGSPSHPREIDHFLFSGTRDWRQPFRALVAGGGTGDALVMLAQLLVTAGCPAEIHYLDMSEAALAVARARIAARGLSNVVFHLGDIRDAPTWAPYDYIDCCGVLHHLTEPLDALRALRDSLSPDGGMGLMVYAPHGRTGVYMLQDAFRSLLGDLPVADKLTLAKSVYDGMPKSAWIHRNPFVGDHKVSDAGFVDSLLHGHDRPYRVSELAELLAEAGLGIVSMLEPVRYEPTRYLPDLASLGERLAGLDAMTRSQLAEDLVGNIKTHVAYVTRTERVGRTLATPANASAVPQLSGADASQLAHAVGAGKSASITFDGIAFSLNLAKQAAPLIAAVDGVRTLAEIAAAVDMDWIAFSTTWAGVHRELTGVNRLHYSSHRWPA